MAEMEGNVRLEALWGLTALAIHDREFRSEALRNLESTLWRYGFALSPQEVDRVRQFQENVANMKDEDLVRELERQYEIAPQLGRWC
jgi:hypothetical protein